MPERAKCRIDKWLWAARFAKTRSAATELVAGGRVHINGARAKPSKDVQVGDVIELTVGDTPWTVEVLDLAERRGSAAVAATLYRETEASRAGRERRAQLRRSSRPLGADLGGRPTKRDRRRIDELRRGRG